MKSKLTGSILCEYGGCDIYSNVYDVNIITFWLLPSRYNSFLLFLLKKRDITSRRPFLFHDLKKMSFVLVCDNCTALKVCPSMRIFPLAQSVHLVYIYNGIVVTLLKFFDSIPDNESHQVVPAIAQITRAVINT